MLSCAYFDLKRLDFDYVRLGFCQLQFLILVVLKFTIIHDFCNRRHCRGGNLDKIEAGFLRTGQSFLEANDTEVISSGRDNAEFWGGNLMVYADFLMDTQVVGGVDNVIIRLYL